MNKQKLIETASEAMNKHGHSGRAVQSVMEAADISMFTAKEVVRDVILGRVESAPEVGWLDSVRGCFVNTKVLPTVYTGPDGTFFITEDTPEIPNPEPEYTVRQVLVTAPMAKLDVFSTLEDARMDVNIRSGL